MPCLTIPPKLVPAACTLFQVTRLYCLTHCLSISLSLFLSCILTQSCNTYWLASQNICELHCGTFSHCAVRRRPAQIKNGIIQILYTASMRASKRVLIIHRYYLLAYTYSISTGVWIKVWSHTHSEKGQFLSNLINNGGLSQLRSGNDDTHPLVRSLAKARPQFFSHSARGCILKIIKISIFDSIELWALIHARV